jgi:hypothetical protein
MLPDAVVAPSVMVDCANTDACRAVSNLLERAHAARTCSIVCEPFRWNFGPFFVGQPITRGDEDKPSELVGGARAASMDLSMRLNTVGHDTSKFRAVL